MSPELNVKIRSKLEEFRPILNSDGGDMTIVSIDETEPNIVVKLSLQGACGSCPSSTMTIKMGIERMLQEEIDPRIVVERV